MKWEKFRKNPDHPWRFLIIRTDRIGDSVLTLPVISSLKSFYPQSKISVLCRDYSAPVFEFHPGVNEIILFKENEGPFSLAKRLKRGTFDCSICVYSRASTFFSLFLAGIPYKTGRGFNPGMIFLNRPHFQKRSFNQKHEIDYNLDLISDLVPLGKGKNSQKNREFSFKMAKKTRFLNQKVRVALHPFSGGSALNFSPEKYLQLGSLILSTIPKAQLFFSGSESEWEKWRGFFPDGGGLIFELPKGGLKGYMDYLSTMDLFLGPSTGPLHLASALDVYYIGFFSPVKGQSPWRWGPLGKIGRGKTVIPPIPIICPSCIKEKCPHFNCMNFIPEGREIVAALEEFVRSLEV